MKEVLVSLIIPAYNVQELLPLTLDSVLSQTLESFECIIVDDFSTDSTKLVIQKYLKKDNRFKLISHRANGGLSAARNTGIRFAKGKYIAFLDSDDLLMPESLRLRAQTLEENQSEKVIGTYSGSLAITMDCKISPKGKAVKLKVIDFITAGGNCPFNANQPMFKTSLFRKFGGFDHSLKQAEDYDMWMRILRCGFVFVPTNLYLVTYRQTQGSMIREKPLMHLDISFSKYMSSFDYYPASNFNERFSSNLMKPLHEYSQELNITNRVLEFSGLAVANGEDESDIVDRLVSYLPNYFNIIEHHRDFRKGLYRGIKRFHTNDLSIIEKQYLDMKVHEVYVLFKAILTEQQHHSILYDIECVSGEEILSEKIISQYSLQKTVDVFFFPHKDYHVQKIHLLRPFLDSLGIKFLVVDFSMHYRDEGVTNTCKKLNIPTIGYSNFVLSNFRPKAIAVFNDWDPIVKSIVLAARKSGIHTIGIVEGIQDYSDADTKQNREAYQTVETLLLPGEFDKKYFIQSNQDVSVAGLPRIYELYHSQRKEDIVPRLGNSKVALINSNFSYGVLEEYRDFWLERAVEACKRADYTIIISRHPADKGELYNEYVQTNSFFELLPKADVLISRFATGILEALAMDVMPIYFNPHSEKVDKFTDTTQAYPKADTTEALCDILNNLEEHYIKHRPNFEIFLSNHCGDLNVNPSKKIASVIADRIKNSNGNVEFFKKNLDNIDRVSGVFNNLTKLREWNDSSRDLISLNYDDVFEDLKLKIHQKEYKKSLELVEMMYTFANSSNSISSNVLSTLELSLHKLIRTNS